MNREATGGAPQWTFIVGARILIAVPPILPAEAINALRTLVDDHPASIESVVERISDWDEDISLAIVVLHNEDPAERNEVSITCLVQGSASVDVFSVGGRRRFTGDNSSGRMLADFEAVTAVVVGGTEIAMAALAATLEDAVPLSASVVRAGQLVWSVEPAATSSAASAPPAEHPVFRQPDADADDTIIRPPRRQPVFESPTSLPGVPASWSDSAPPATTAFYRFRIGGCDAMPLASDAYIGRKPRTPRVTRGGEPQLVTVSSPHREVSGTHVKIAQEGNSIVVTDLATMNGTIVSIPGARSVRLRQSQSLVVIPGTRLDIGDGNIIEILSFAP